MKRKPRWLGPVLIGVLFVFLASIVLVWFSPKPLLAVLISIGLFMTGFLIGFVFGIPKYDWSKDDPGASIQTLDRNRFVLPNTNLGEVSDWLTKTIVGLGLVELKDLPHIGIQVATYIAAMLGPDQQAAGYANAIILDFPIVGFVAGYLVTSLVISPLLSDAAKNMTTSEAREELGKFSEQILAPAYVDGTAQFLPATIQIAKDVAKRRFEDLLSLDDIRAWARANMILAKYELAIRGFRLVIQANPYDIRARLELATALDKNTNDKETIIAEMTDNLEQARRRMGEEESVQIRRGLCEYLVYAYLYILPPRGFEKSIAYGEEFILTELCKDDESIWANLAAAYGQQYQWQHELRLGDDDLRATRDKTLYAVRRAIELDPKNRKFFQRLLQRAYPGKRRDDTDLESFETDPEFRKLIIGDPVA